MKIKVHLTLEIEGVENIKRFLSRRPALGSLRSEELLKELCKEGETVEVVFHDEGSIGLVSGKLTRVSTTTIYPEVKV